jgi:magnesium chelatase subunit D
MAAGLQMARTVIRSERTRDPRSRATWIVISDGEANVGLREGRSIESELDELSDAIRTDGILTVVLDSNPRFSASASLRRWAARAGGAYHHIASDGVANVAAAIGVGTTK